MLNSRRISFGCEIVPKFTSQITLNTVDESWIPLYEGVYMFHDLRGIYYIGESNNLRRRFEEHKSNKNSNLLCMVNKPIHKPFFSWIQTYDREKRLSLEKKLIKHFKPICNSILYNNTKIGDK